MNCSLPAGGGHRQSRPGGGSVPVTPAHALSLAQALAVALAFGGALLGMGPAARAVLPEPGARIFGTVALEGVVVTAADTDVVVEARRTPTGPPIASYRMGSLPAAGNFYSIKVQAEDLAPLSHADNLPLGTTFFLIVRDATGVRDQKDFELTERGLSARVDFGALDTDADGMSDAFELANFGSATGGNPNGDPDLDGRPNLREFLQDTNPNVADGRHPADITPADDRLTLTEVTDYILAWKTGGTWPVEPALNATNIVDYITRAGALWKGGEIYVFDNTPPTNAPMWWVNIASPALAGGGGGPRRASLQASPRAGLQVERGLPLNYQPNMAVAVTVDATPSEETRAFALVETPPAGWTVRNLSHEGRWDSVNRQIKWGPFFDQTPRRFTYDAVPGPEAGGGAAFAGRGSFDGYGFAPDGPNRVWPAGQVPAPRLVAMPEASGVRVELHGEPGRRYEVQSSDNLVTWIAGLTVTLDGEGRGTTTATSGTTALFFRLKPLE